MSGAIGVLLGFGVCAASLAVHGRDMDWPTAPVAGAGFAEQNAAKRAVLERGRYLLVVGGCNDCHTPGYAESGGKTPEAQWLTGSEVGFRGPWGTTYPGNLRLSAAVLTESEWLKQARLAMRPPMPSPSLAAMTDGDLKAVYRYIRSLGVAGKTAPDYVPPDQVVTTPYVDFVPRSPAQAVPLSQR